LEKEHAVGIALLAELIKTTKHIQQYQNRLIKHCWEIC